MECLKSERHGGGGIAPPQPPPPTRHLASLKTNRPSPQTSLQTSSDFLASSPEAWSAYLTSQRYWGGGSAPSPRPPPPTCRKSYRLGPQGLLHVLSPYGHTDIHIPAYTRKVTMLHSVTKPCRHVHVSHMANNTLSVTLLPYHKRTAEGQDHRR